MKTCPLNKVIDADGALLTRVASWLGIHARPLKRLLVPVATRLDDWLGDGKRNAVKKWWFDHEIVDGVAVVPKGTNQRDIDPGRRVDAAKHKVAYYPASAMPAPDAAGPVPVDRKAGLAAEERLETPAAALARKARSGAPPADYIRGGDHRRAGNREHGGSISDPAGTGDFVGKILRLGLLPP